MEGFVYFFIAVLQYFLPLGDTVAAINGDKGLTASVEKMLTSRYALVNRAFPFGEAAIAWLCVLLINSSSHQIPVQYFCYAGVVPAVLMLLLLPLIRWVSEKQGPNPTTEVMKKEKEKEKKKRDQTLDQTPDQRQNQEANLAPDPQAAI